MLSSDALDYLDDIFAMEEQKAPAQDRQAPKPEYETIEQTQEIKSLSIAPRDTIAQRVNSPEVCEENASADPDGAQHSFSQGGDSHGAQRRIERGRGDQPNEESPLPYNPR